MKSISCIFISLFLSIFLSSFSKAADSGCRVSAAGIYDAVIRLVPCEGDGCESVGEVNLSLKLKFDAEGAASGHINFVRSGLDDKNFFQLSRVSANGEMLGTCIPEDSFHVEAMGVGVFVLERFLGGPAIHAPARFDIDSPGDDGAELKITFFFEDGSSFVQNLTLRSGQF